MRRIFISVLMTYLLSITIHAQDDAKNVIMIIENAKEEYRYTKGSNANPVKIKQNITTTYVGTEYRTEIPIVEFYNDQLELNNIDVKINGDRVKNFKPVYDHYSSEGIFYSDARICYFTLPLERRIGI